ncbi:MAG TPA: TMEM175 family protein [Polyangia bacterium]|nr:TMEM175 family protein [Polyangia bacterium]
MSKGRLEAFSDGVIAIIITIMVLELKVPKGADVAALRPLAPVFASYVLSFVMIGIYWNNHHHLFQAVDRVNGRILWANLHLLFWLSQIPFTTAWMGENHFAPLPTALDGFILLMAGVGYYLLVRAILAHHGRESRVAKALGRDFKGKVSVLLYMVALPLAFMNPWLAVGIYTLVALIWFVPDRRIEGRVGSE